MWGDGGEELGLGLLEVPLSSPCAALCEVGVVERHCLCEGERALGMAHIQLALLTH